MVSKLDFYSNDPISNPTEVYSFYYLPKIAWKEPK